MSDQALLIDLSSLYWSAWHATKDAEMSSAQSLTLKAVHKVIAATRPEHIAICCDAAGPTFRHEMTKDLPPEQRYKANREAKDPAALDQLRQTLERLARDGFLLWTAPGFEADDVIATATAEAVKRGHAVIIATADKDLLQLVAEDVTVYNTKTDLMVDPPAVSEKIGIPPAKVRDYLALVGDAADNVPGVPGIGTKRACDLLVLFGDVEGIVRAAMDPTKGGFTPKVRESILANRPSLTLSRDLVTLRFDVPLVFDDLFLPRSQKPLDVREYEPEAEEAPEAELVQEPDAQTEEPGHASEADLRVLGAHLQAAVDRGQVVGHVEPPAEVVKANGKPKPEEPEPVTSLVHVPFERGLQPTGPQSAWMLSQKLYQSRLYQKFTSPEAILAVIIRGREMGLCAGTALDCFHVIEGKPSLYAWLIIALAEQDPQCEYLYCSESTPDWAVWETKKRRNPKPQSLHYSWAEAEEAGLTVSRPGKGPNSWHKNRADMLRKTCGVKLARFVYPAAALGLYASEELGGDTNE